jgi:predicted AlkP superfamily phosphohydrolase/phosphomutase
MPAVLTSADVRAPMLWHWPQIADLRTAVVNVQLTHPPEPINGSILSYLMGQSLRYSYPSELAHDLSRQGMAYGHDVSVFYRGEGADSFHRRVMQVARNQLEAACALARTHDLLIVNLTAVDRLSHFLWRDMETGCRPDQSRLADAYGFVDAALARLEVLAGDDPMIVFSEIGFGPLERFESLDDLLATGGFLSLDRDGEVDPSATRAREAPQGSHGILLDESAAPGSGLAEEVAACLLEGRAADGKRLVAQVLRREEIYPGPALHLAPDLVVVPESPERPPLGDRRWARHVNRGLQTGWHRDMGWIAFRGADAASEGPAKLEAIAPTIVALLGREPPASGAPPLAARC